MTNDEFETKVKNILHRQPQEKVDELLSYFDYVGIVQMVRKVDHNLSLMAEEQYVNDAAKCLPYIKRLNDYHKAAVSDEIQDHFKHVINWLEGVPSRKKHIRPHGRPSALTNSEISLLWQLRSRFRHIFPELSSKFTQGNLICQIGEVLLGIDELPKTIDKQIDKLNPVCSSLPS